MKHKHSTNSKNSVKKVYTIFFACTIIGISLYGCKKDEPQQEETSQPTSEQTPTESAKDTLPDNSIELAKWEEGKSLAGFVAVALRAYAAENDMNIDYENITVQKLFDTPDDLQGFYFDINNLHLSDVSFDSSRTEHPLRYTITVTRPDESWKIKSFKLLHTGQWIQTP